MKKTDKTQPKQCRGQKKPKVKPEKTKQSSDKIIASNIRDITERKRAEEALRESEARYRLLVETLPDGVIVHSQGRVVFANPASATLIGAASPAELVGKPVIQFVHPDYRELALKRIQQSLSEGVPAPVAEEKFVRLDGTPIDLQVSASPFSYAGKPAMLTICSDITERKRAEEALRESERELKEAQLLGRVGNWEYDIESQKITWSDQVYRLYERDPVLAPPTAEEEAAYYSPEQAQMLHEYARRAVEEGQDFEYDLEATLPSGKHVSFSAKMRPVKDVRGRIVKLFGTVQDITERKRAEQALAESEIKFRWLYEYAPVAYHILTPEGTITDVNRRWCELLGYRREEALGKAIFDFVVEEEREAAKDSFEKKKQSQQFFIEGSERNFGTKDGAVRTFKTHDFFVLDQRQNITSVQTTIEDITERKRAEEALRLRMEQLVALNQASQAVTASLDLDQVLAEIMSLAGKVVASDYASVVLVDEAGLISSGIENLPGIPSIEIRIRGKGFTRWIIRSRRAAVADEIGEEGVIRPRVGGGAPRTANPNLVAKGIKSFVGLPLMVKDHIVGVLYLHSLRPGTFHDQLTLLTTFASQAAIAIEKARLYEMIQKELTERKQAEEALQRESDTAQQYLDIAGVLMAALNTDGQITLINPKGCEILGYKESELIGRNWFDTCLSEDAREEVRSVIERLMAGDIEPVEYYENAVLTKRGAQRILAFHNAVIRNQASQIIGILFSGEDITERKRAEEALRESEEKYRNLVERANDGIVIVQDGIVKYINARLAEMRGVTVEEVIGTPFTDHIYPDELPEVVDRYKQRMAGEDISPIYETALRRRDGSKIHAELNAGMVTYQGKPADLVIVRDITERKLAEAELQASREAERNFAERLTTLSETTTELSKAESLDELCRRAVELGRERLDFDRPSVWFITEDSTAILGTFGVDAEGQITDERGDSYPVTLGFDTWPVLQGQVPLLRLTDGPLWLKGQVVGQGTHVVAGLWDGNTVIGYVSVDNQLRHRPFSDRDCEIIRLYASAVGHLVSIKRAEDRLHDSEERYRLLFELSPDSIAVYQDGKVVFANPAAAKLMGASTLEEFVGKPVMDFVHPDYRKLVIERSRQQMTDGKIVPALEEKFLRLDGTVIDVDVTAAPINYRNKASTMVIFRDITERKRAEAELQASREAERIFSERLTILSETTTELSKAESLDGLCRRAIELGRERLDFDRLSIWFYSEDTAAILGTYGIDTEGRITDERGDRYPVSALSYLWPILQSQTPLIRLEDAPLALKGKDVGQGTHVIAGLWDGNRAIGFISVDNLLRQRPFSDRDCEIIRLYASAVGHLVSIKRAQEETRATEERFEKSFQSNPIATIINILPEGRILDVNNTFLRITGYSREEVIGKTGLELGLWENPEDRIRLARALIAQESLRDVEGRLLTKSGESREILASVETIQIAGQPHGLIMLNDVTERKRAEETLRQSEAKYHSIFDNAAEGIFQSTPEGKFLTANPAMARILGFSSPEELIRERTDIARQSYVHPEQREEFKRLMEQQNKVSGFEYEVPRKDGSVAWVSETAQAVWDATGRIVGYEGIFIDITERKQAVEALARQAEELRQRNEELARLYRASGSLISGTLLRYQDLAQTIVEIVQQEFGQSNCSLLVVQKDSNELVRLVASGPYAERVKYQNLALDGLGLIPLAIRTNKVVNVGDVHSSPDYVQGWEAAQSELAIPLKVGSDVIGAIDVQSSEPNAFSPDDERLMTVFAERAALALGHSRLNAQTEARLQQLIALRTVDMAISGSFDINLTLGVLLDQLTGQLGVHAVDILVFNATTQTFKFACERGFRTQLLHHTQLRFGAGYAWRAIRERRVIVVPDIRVEPDGLQRSPDLSGEQFVAYLGVPLIAKGQIKGVLEVFHREPLVLEKEWVGFLEMLAGQAAIAIDNAELFDHLQRSNADLTMAYDSTLEGWASALELRDKATEGHTRRVTELTTQLARALGVKEKDMVHIYRGALLHDIGKVGVPDSIVLKPGPLTEDEWVIMRKHPQYAYNMLSPIAYLRLALDIPYCHHEKWDGTGYPRGLKGEQIPLAARIFAVVDVWDALNSDRPYRKAWQEAKARQYIQEQAGLYFDPQVVRAFLKEFFQKG